MSNIEQRDSRTTTKQTYSTNIVIMNLFRPIIYCQYPIVTPFQPNRHSESLIQLKLHTYTNRTLSRCRFEKIYINAD